MRIILGTGTAEFKVVQEVMLGDNFIAGITLLGHPYYSGHKICLSWLQVLNPRVMHLCVVELSTRPSGVQDIYGLVRRQIEYIAREDEQVRWHETELIHALTQLCTMILQQSSAILHNAVDVTAGPGVLGINGLITVST